MCELGVCVCEPQEAGGKPENANAKKTDIVQALRRGSTCDLSLMLPECQMGNDAADPGELLATEVTDAGENVSKGTKYMRFYRQLYLNKKADTRAPPEVLEQAVKFKGSPKPTLIVWPWPCLLKLVSCVESMQAAWACS